MLVPDACFAEGKSSTTFNRHMHWLFIFECFSLLKTLAIQKIPSNYVLKVSLGLNLLSLLYIQPFHNGQCMWLLNINQSSMLSLWKQGKSEGFESCDRPIVRKRPIWVKIGDVLYVWPWNLMDDLGKQKGISPLLFQALCNISQPLVNSNWSYSPETPNLGQIRRFLELCDLEIWRMTLKNNRAPLLCYFKRYASFRSHQWIEAGVTVRKRPIWLKINDFLSRVAL